MRFCHLRKEQECKSCGQIVLKGEEAVIIMYSSPQGMIPYILHTGCYLNWTAETFAYRYNNWKQGNLPRKVKPHRGRPRKYKNHLKATRLLSLLHYYRCTGKQDKIKELTDELRELEIEHNTD